MCSIFFTSVCFSLAQSKKTLFHLRSSENKMDSSNLAVIFAPNLLQTNEGHEKMSANTEKKLRLQAAVVQTLIDYASDIGKMELHYKVTGFV